MTINLEQEAFEYNGWKIEFLWNDCMHQEVKVMASKENQRRAFNIEWPFGYGPSEHLRAYISTKETNKNIKSRIDNFKDMIATYGKEMGLL